MEAIMAAGLGDKLNVVGFCFTLLGGLMALVGTVLMFVGSGLAGEGIWQNLKKVQHMAEQASVPHAIQWSAPQGILSSDFVPLTPIKAYIGYTMQSADTRTPLEMRFSSEADGSGLQAFASGSSGQLSMLVTGDVFYVSVSHPSIVWGISSIGWEETR